MGSDSDKQLDRKLALTKKEQCDKYDYLIAVACGAIAGLVDIFLVGTPGDSVLGNWSDNQIDKAVMTFAKCTGWKGDNIASAIGYLERSFPVNYDQRYTSDVGGAFQMGTRNHHLKSLAHSPDPIGLFFSILDQFQGQASFVANGQLIRIDTTGSAFELRGNTLPAKLFCGFCNWVGHLMSDIAGSSGGRGTGGRGSGIAIPFFELFQFCDVGKIQIGKDRQSFSILMTRVFQEGYDFRFGVAQTIPILLCDLFIRAIWALKRHFHQDLAWELCIPNNSHGDLRWMLIVGNATLCIFDGADAIIRSGGNPIQFVMRLNLIAWFKLILMVLKEIAIRYSFTYEDLKTEFQRINAALASYIEKLKTIDYEMYEQELRDLAQINELLRSDKGTSILYLYLEKSGSNMQFKNFEEFDEKISKDKNFVLEI